MSLFLIRLWVLCLQNSSSISKICNTLGHSVTFSAKASSVSVRFMAELLKQQESYHVFLYGRRQLVIINELHIYFDPSKQIKLQFFFSFLHIQLSAQLGSNTSLNCSHNVCWLGYASISQACMWRSSGLAVGIQRQMGQSSCPEGIPSQGRGG